MIDLYFKNQIKQQGLYIINFKLNFNN